MSYGIQYRGEYQSPMRDKRRYMVDISTKDYVGEVKELYFTGDGVVISHGGVDDNELQPLKVSSATLNLEIIDEEMSHLFSLDPFQHRLQISELREMQTIPMWNGYLATGSYSHPYKDPPYQLTLQANDGLALLRSLPYRRDDDTLFDDVLTLRGLFERLLAPLADWMAIMIWNLPKVSVAQEEETVDIVGVSARAIYAALEEPTYYDVLVAMLQLFGLQLAQECGRWIIRPTMALASPVRPAWWEDSIFKERLQGGGDILPIYEMGGSKGVSTSATLSMLPPLKALKVSRSNEDVKIALQQSIDNWQINFEEGYYTAEKRSTIEGVRIRMKGYNGTADPGGIWLHALDGQIYGGRATAKVQLDFNLYPLQSSSVDYGISYFLVKSNESPFDLFEFSHYFPSGGPTTIATVKKDLYMWNPNRTQWERRSAGTPLPTLNVFSPTLEAKGSKDISFNRIVPLSTLEKVSSSVTFESLPNEIGWESMTLVVGISSISYNWAFEITDMQLTFLQNKLIEAENNEARDYEINSWGTESIDIDQKFTTGVRIPISGELNPYIMEVVSGAPVRGYVVPSRSMNFAGALAATLRSLRGDVTTEIEGDIYTGQSVGFETVMRSAEGKYYAPVKIDNLLRRGLTDMQLREILPLSKMKEVNVGWSVSSYVTFDTSIIFTSPDLPGVSHYDFLTQKLTTLLSTKNPITLSSGVDCASVIEQIDGVYSAYAWDESGRRLSYIYDLANSDADMPISPAYIRYDASNSTWVCVGNSGSVMSIYILSSAGEVLDSSTKSGVTVSRVCVFPNGFVISQNEGGSWWYSHSISDTLEPWYRSIDVAGVTDTMIISVNYNTVTIYPRTDGIDGYGEAVYQAQGVVEDANCALVLITDRRGLFTVFDARSLTWREIQAPNTRARGMIAGDVVYILYVGMFYPHRILEGDGYYTMLDVDGNNIVDSGYNELVCKKYRYGNS